MIFGYVTLDESLSRRMSQRVRMFETKETLGDASGAGLRRRHPRLNRAKEGRARPGFPLTMVMAAWCSLSPISRSVLVGSRQYWPSVQGSEPIL